MLCARVVADAAVRAFLLLTSSVSAAQGCDPSRESAGSARTLPLPFRGAELNLQRQPDESWLRIGWEGGGPDEQHRRTWPRIRPSRRRSFAYSRPPHSGCRLQNAMTFREQRLGEGLRFHPRRGTRSRRITVQLRGKRVECPAGTARHRPHQQISIFFSGARRARP